MQLSKQSERRCNIMANNVIAANKAEEFASNVSNGIFNDMRKFLNRPNEIANILLESGNKLLDDPSLSSEQKLDVFNQMQNIGKDNVQHNNEVLSKFASCCAYLAAAGLGIAYNNPRLALSALKQLGKPFLTLVNS
jgi:hypothetical protein